MAQGDSPAAHHSIVDDACEPAAVDHYTEDDLECFSLRALYRRSSEKLGVAPVEAIAAQLASEPGDHHKVTALNAEKSYLGWRRCAALVPVVEACPRLTHLHFSAVAMDAAVAKALLRVLRGHPGIQFVDVSRNDLGARVGELLLRLVTEHCRIHTAIVEHCLFVTPVHNKIKRQLAKNYAMRDQFTVPLIPERVTPADIAAAKLREEQERLRQERAEAERQRRAEAIPAWAPAALLELHQTLHKHRRHVIDVSSVFKTAEPGDCVTDGRNFVRAMKILDVRSLADADGATACEFADLVCAWDRKRDVINFQAVIAALRTHAAVVGGPNAGRSAALAHALDAPAHQCVLDAIHDARSSLRRGFEMIDVDMTGTVSADEVLVGVAAVTAAPRPAVEDVVRALLVPLPEPPAPAAKLENEEESAADSGAAASPSTTDAATADNDEGVAPAPAAETLPPSPQGTVPAPASEPLQEKQQTVEAAVAAAALPPIPSRIRYTDLLDHAGITEAHDADVPRSDWDLKRSQLRAIAVASQLP